MSRLHKILLVVIGLELVQLAVLAAAHLGARPLPRARISRYEPLWADDLRRLQAAEPAGAEDWLRLGGMYRAFGLFHEADYCFQQGHDLGFERNEYLLHWGMALDRAGRFEEALARYAEAAAKDSRSAPLAWQAIGLVQLRLGDYAAAEEALRKAGKAPCARLMLARRLSRSGRAEQARVLLDELLREFPKDLHANQLRGWCAEEQGDSAAAPLYEDRSRRGIVQIMHMLQPTAAEDEARRGAVGIRGAVSRASRLAAAGQPAEAVELLVNAAEKPLSGMMAERLATWQLEAGQKQEALQTLQESLARFGPESGASLITLGKVHAALGDHAQARAAWTQAYDIRPSAEIQSLLAESCEATGDSAAAQRHRALAEFERGKAAWLINDLPSAKESLQTASRSLPDHVHTWFYLAETLRLLEDVIEAPKAYQQCLKINPHHGRAMRSLEFLGAK